MTATKAIRVEFGNCIKRAEHIAQLVGPIDEFEAEVQAGIESGRYDPREMPMVVAAVRRWVAEGL